MSDVACLRSPVELGSSQLLDALSVAAVLLGRDGRWLHANPVAAALLQAEPGALAGLPAHRLRLPGLAGQIDAALADDVPLRDASASLDEPNGRARHLQVRLQPLGDGSTWLLELHDHSALRDLEVLQETLGFGISHELRAPVRAIEQFSRRLEAQVDAPEPAATLDHLRRIRHAAAQAGRLIDGLLDTMRASRPPRAPGPVDVSMLGEWVCAELQDAAPTRAADIHVAPDLWVWGDEHALKQMLGKLIDNAWRFSAQRERVRIHLDGERRGERQELRLRDEGSGFDMRYADRLFVPFRRLHGVEAGAGHGLGLAIAQRIAQAHGGHIRVHSEPDVGTTFTIDLPAVPAEDARSP
ncbi:PAS domain-containing sensor histidine kinase [Luteimonas deserti]|uniref:histidine kinase n=1 Tax=Luteimonas deserti TaxID=2752306 RepID=A0A7Z0TT06_9GAMM|nr:HAMP domain-containing sensor histidine kinase [Luteimonas deserti]NYZ61311.1 HAMP domain-containing histidine kinase [Luteimonas deserti]